MKKGSSTSGTKGDSGMPKSRQSKLSGKQNGTADSVPKPRGGQKNHKGQDQQARTSPSLRNTPRTPVPGAAWANFP